VLNAIGEADIIANLTVNLGRNSSIDNALDGHIFNDILQGDIEGNHIFIVLYEITVLFKEGLLLKHEFLVESYGFDIFLQSCDEVEI
jgi:hypothetical protein